MIKDIEAKNENKSICDKEIAVLKEYFPSCFTKDGAFDIELLKETLNQKIDITKEGYELKFLGKSYAKLLTSLDTTTVITPDVEHNNLSVNKESENIYISGDNLDGLKHLLKSYANEIKCIYIDPPYNTGSDGFVYNDSFNFTSEDLQHKLSVEEDEAQRILELTNKGSASHSAWLLFMYSRLQLARDLLTIDGVIFLSIDDNELANLRRLCDDIFGEENFISQIMVIANPGGRDYNQVAVTHEYLLCYSRTDDAELNEIEKKASFKCKDKDGGYNIRELRNRNPKFHSGNRPNLFYPFYVNPNSKDEYNCCAVSLVPSKEFHIEVKPYNSKCQESVWRWGKKLSGENIIENNPFESQIVAREKRKGGWNIYEKNRRSTTKVKSIWDESGLRTEDGTRQVRELFGENLFDHPKPIDLIKKVISIGSNDDIVLDFFSGSATMAHSVLELNSESKDVKRKFIAIQLPEILDLKNPNQKNAHNFLKSINRPTTLDYVGIERIIRASKKIKEDTKADIDYGFKHYILNEPEQNTLDKCETFDKASLIPDGSILEDFGAETVLTTWLNYDGYGLNTNAQEIDLNGYVGYYYDKHLYLINPNFTKENVVALFEKYEAIGDFNPENVILFGYSFNEWSVTEMLQQNLKILNDTEKNLKININVRY